MQTIKWKVRIPISASLNRESRSNTGKLKGYVLALYYEYDFYFLNFLINRVTTNHFCSKSSDSKLVLDFCSKLSDSELVLWKCYSACTHSKERFGNGLLSMIFYRNLHIWNYLNKINIFFNFIKESDIRFFDKIRFRLNFL